MFVSNCWEYSEQRTTVLPFLTSEALDSILAIPWNYRAGRRLVKKTIERLQPALAKIHHDSGAPMESLKIANIYDYYKYAINYLKDLTLRHFITSSNVPKQSPLDTIPKQWLTWLIENTDSSSIGNSLHLLELADKGSYLSNSEVNEIQMLILLKALKKKYPDLCEELTFDHIDAMSKFTDYKL